MDFRKFNDLNQNRAHYSKMRALLTWINIILFSWVDLGAGLKIACPSSCLSHTHSQNTTQIHLSHKSFLTTKINLPLLWGFPGGSVVRESTCQWRRLKRHRFYSSIGKIPWRRKWWPTPVFLSGKSHGQRSRVGYSPWGREEWETIQGLSTLVNER